MKTKKLVALKNLYYGRDRCVGEEFDAEEEHAQMMVRVGAAAPVEPDKKSKHYSRRDMRAED